MPTKRDLTLRGQHIVDGALGAFGHSEITEADNELRIVCGSENNPQIFRSFSSGEQAFVDGLRIIIHLWDSEQLLSVVRGLTVSLYTSNLHCSSWKKATRCLHFQGNTILDNRMGRWEIGHRGERICNIWTINPHELNWDTKAWIVITLDSAALEIFHEIERNPSPEKFASVEVRLLGDFIKEEPT